VHRVFAAPAGGGGGGGDDDRQRKRPVQSKWAREREKEEEEGGRLDKNAYSEGRFSGVYRKQYIQRYCIRVV
jgi:hypothetical protein